MIQKGIVFLLISITFFVSLIYLNAQNMKMIITIGDKKFTATLDDCSAAKEFASLLPLSLVMNEHNGNEKFANLSKSITGKASMPRKIEAGEIMIWGNSTIVLFYADLYPSYNYIRIGRIDNTEGLKEAVGIERIKVTLELTKVMNASNENDIVTR